MSQSSAPADESMNTKSDNDEADVGIIRPKPLDVVSPVHSPDNSMADKQVSDTSLPEEKAPDNPVKDEGLGAIELKAEEKTKQDAVVEQINELVIEASESPPAESKSQCVQETPDVVAEKEPTDVTKDDDVTKNNVVTKHNDVSLSVQPITEGAPETDLNTLKRPLEASSDSAAEGPATATETARDGNGSVYHIKWVRFKDQNTPIVTQNENGPCPLLAVINILLLSQRVTLSQLTEIVTSQQLMEYLGHCILENAPKNVGEGQQLNFEQNMADAIAVLPKLQTGLDVNVKFTGVQDFEFTSECIVFDLLRLRLLHGWLVDPACPEERAAVGNCSYNQLVEKVISNKSSSRDDLVTEALLAQRFLEQSMSQLTYHGLCELSSAVKNDELCVLFRNNHFSTLYKHKNELFVLVTDQGFLTESNVVWETLSNVEGDCHFVDGDFRTYTKPEPEPLASQPLVSANTPQQLDHDYLLALSMQQEADQQGGSQDTAAELGSAPAWDPAALALSDHELALRMQQEEQLLAQRAAEGQGQATGATPPSRQQSSSSSERKKSSDVVKNGPCNFIAIFV